jgi:hypothetical protein
VWSRTTIFACAEEQQFLRVLKNKQYMPSRTQLVSHDCSRKTYRASLLAMASNSFLDEPEPSCCTIKNMFLLNLNLPWYLDPGAAL